jgi:hypothetical protein
MRTLPRYRSWTAAAFLAAGLALPAAARIPAFPVRPIPLQSDAPAAAPAAEAEIATARTALIARLVEVAAWCHKVELFEERDKLYEQILVLDPKNIDAHKGLGHSRSTDGTWKESKRHVYKNRSTKFLPDLPAKRAEAMKPFSDRMIALATAATDAAVRAAYVAAVTAIDPNDPTLHAWQGDEKDGERWVLPETVRAREQRAKIKALVRGAMDGAPPATPEQPIDSDPVPEFPWKSGVTTGFVRVLTTGSEEDAKTLARTCTAAGTLVQALFGKECQFPTKYTFYLVDPAQKVALLAKLEGYDDEDRARIGKLEGTGLWRRQDVALWTGDKARTLDMSLRHTLSKLLNRGVGLTPTCGWVWEGFGLYLTREITGTRLTWFVAADSATAKAASLQARLLAQDANWMNEALTLLSGPDAPSIADVMKRDLAKLEVRDVITAYALAAYLLEARPEQVTDLVRRSCNGEDPEAIVQKVLSMSTDQLSQRLARWLSERK